MAVPYGDPGGGTSIALLISAAVKRVSRAHDARSIADADRRRTHDCDRARRRRGGRTPRGPSGDAGALWLTTFSSCAIFTALTRLLVIVTPAVVGCHADVAPADAAIAGWVLLGETSSCVQVAGMLVVRVAIAILGGSRQRRRISPV